MIRQHDIHYLNFDNISSLSYKGYNYYMVFGKGCCYKIFNYNKEFLIEDDMQRYVDKVLLREKKLERLKEI